MDLRHRLLLFVDLHFLSKDKIQGEITFLSILGWADFFAYVRIFIPCSPLRSILSTGVRIEKSGTIWEFHKVRISRERQVALGT